MRMRWVIVGLLFFATTINYLDRAILGVILPEIRDQFHFGLETYGVIQFWFQIAYAGGRRLSSGPAWHADGVWDCRRDLVSGRYAQCVCGGRISVFTVSCRIGTR